MTLHPRLSRAAVALVKRFETFQPLAERTPAGGWSIGYGHTASAREGARIDEAAAEALLIYDLDRAARAVERALFAPVTQAQFEALTALCFNLGEVAFLRSSALARTNAGAELDAADEIERWRQAELGAGTQVVDALVRRRAAEKAHFLGLSQDEAKWPSALHRPLPTAGGEVCEPTTEIECPASAALTAANGVQARLRRLIPEETPVAESSLFRPDVEEPADPAEAAPEPEELFATFVVAPAVLQPDPAPVSETEVAWEQTPPPFDASPQPNLAPDTLATLHEPPMTGASADRIGRDVLPAMPQSRRQTARPFYGLLGLVGAALFVVAVAMILTGRASLLALGLGVVGVLLAAPGVYGVLGGGRGPEADAAAPFHRGAPDTK